MTLFCHSSWRVKNSVTAQKGHSLQWGLCHCFPNCSECHYISLKWEKQLPHVNIVGNLRGRLQCLGRWTAVGVRWIGSMWAEWSPVVRPSLLTMLEITGACCNARAVERVLVGTVPSEQNRVQWSGQAFQHVTTDVLKFSLISVLPPLQLPINAALFFVYILFLLLYIFFMPPKSLKQEMAGFLFAQFQAATGNSTPSKACVHIKGPVLQNRGSECWMQNMRHSWRRTALPKLKVRSLSVHWYCYPDFLQLQQMHHLEFINAYGKTLFWESRKIRSRPSLSIVRIDSYYHYPVTDSISSCSTTTTCPPNKRTNWTSHYSCGARTWVYYAFWFCSRSSFLLRFTGHRFNPNWVSLY